MKCKLVPETALMKSNGRKDQKLLRVLNTPDLVHDNACLSFYMSRYMHACAHKDDTRLCDTIWTSHDFCCFKTDSAM